MPHSRVLSLPSFVSITKNCAQVYLLRLRQLCIHVALLDTSLVDELVATEVFDGNEVHARRHRFWIRRPHLMLTLC